MILKFARLFASSQVGNASSTKHTKLLCVYGGVRLKHLCPSKSRFTPEQALNRPCIRFARGSLMVPHAMLKCTANHVVSIHYAKPENVFVVPRLSLDVLLSV